MPLAKAVEYGYLSARCHVIRSQLLDTQRLGELAGSRSIGEFVSSLSETPYGAFIADASREGVHKGLIEAFAYQRKRLSRELQKRHLEIFELFFHRKYALLDEKQNLALLDSSVGSSEEIFRKIDRTYIGSLEKSMKKLPSSEQRHIKKIVGSYFDLLNLYNLVKFRLLYKRSVEETLSMMLPYAEKFTLAALTELSSAPDLKTLSIRMKPIFGEVFDDYETFRQKLYAYHRKQLLSVWSGYPFSLAIPFSLLRLIEIEISDLRAITEGIAFGLESEEIRTMMVGG
jgi:vacuolar-type H+-ATPase subunit C/Vma6